MKKLFYSYWSLFLVASLLVTTSCGNDDETTDPDRPSFVITGTEAGEETETTVAPGEPVAFTLNINAPGGFNTLYIDKTGGTAQDQITVSRGSTVENTYVYNFSYTPTIEEAGETLIFDFQAVDEAGLDNTYTYTIIVTEPELVEWEQTLLFAPLGNNTSETWFSTSSGETYTSNEVNNTQETISNTIDFGYFYGETREATIASVANFPIEAGQQGWTVKNATKVKKTTLDATAFFETASATTIQQAYDAAEFGSNEGQATNLAEGDVLVFMTDENSAGGSRYGMIHVSTITPGFTSEGSVLINVKVMPGQ